MAESTRLRLIAGMSRNAAVLVANRIAPAFSSNSGPETIANAVPPPIGLVSRYSSPSRLNSATVW